MLRSDLRACVQPAWRVVRAVYTRTMRGSRAALVSLPPGTAHDGRRTQRPLRPQRIKSQAFLRNVVVFARFAFFLGDAVQWRSLSSRFRTLNRMMEPSNRELAALKFLDGLGWRLKDAREPHKTLRHALRDTREFFHATDGCVAVLQAGRAEADVLLSLPKDAQWNTAALTRFIRYPHPPDRQELLMASL